MIDRDALLQDCKGVLRKLENDIRQREESSSSSLGALKAEYQVEKEKKVTSLTFNSWVDDQVVQAAVAWVLTTVFIRYCEDNGLVDEWWISGPTGDGGENFLERARAHRD